MSNSELEMKRAWKATFKDLYKGRQVYSVAPVVSRKIKSARNDLGKRPKTRAVEMKEQQELRG